MKKLITSPRFVAVLFWSLAFASLAILACEK
jgi:hypothetical protein